MSCKVLLFAQPDARGEPHKTIRAAGIEIVPPDPSWAPGQANLEESVAKALRECDAVCAAPIRLTHFTRTILEGSDKLRLVALFTIGTDHVDSDAATDMGILVTHGPTESNWGGVAEGVVANMLTMLKKTRERDARIKAGGWRDQDVWGTHLGRRDEDGWAGLTIGIVGLGRVGTRVADLLRPWKVRVLGCDPYIRDAHFAEHGVTKTDLDTLLAESDIVTLHTYLNNETRRMIGAPRFARMKPSAILVNASRGPVVDEQAIIQALQENRIAGAALDVFEVEPLPADSPLRQMGDKVLLSPHSISGGNAGSGLGPAIRWAGEAVVDALSGKVPTYVFNRAAIPGWQQRFGGKSVL
ncbi:MAG: NAD(P)-dependent oxidoreductase [Chloroflexota bacterium]